MDDKIYIMIIYIGDCSQKNGQITEVMLGVMQFCTINFIFEESWHTKFCVTAQKKMHEIF